MEQQRKATELQSSSFGEKKPLTDGSHLDFVAWQHKTHSIKGM